MIAYFKGRRRAALFYREAAAAWKDRPAVALEPVDAVRILPLMDFYAERDDLETEPGVSYAIEAGGTRVLFDLAFNGNEDAEPPLLRNMRRLGVDPAGFDLVVLSHPHSDHLGGKLNKQARRAVLLESDDPLVGKPHYATVPLSVTDGVCEVVEQPRRLAPGVGTTGPLPVQLMPGYTLEQVLVFHVRGRGLVLVIGCGHPGLRNMVESAELFFKTPVAAVIGGLHYPVTKDRRATGWYKPQKVNGNPNPPWRPISKGTVRAAIRYLKEKNVDLVSLSAHDSCDWSIEAFSAAFGAVCEPLRVGREIRFETRT